MSEKRNEKIRVMCVDGNVFINDTHIRSFEGHDWAMTFASRLVEVMEDELGEEEVEFTFNTGENIDKED